MRERTHLYCCDKELRAVRVLPGVCHGQDSLSVVLDFEGLVIKPTAVDALPTGSRSRGEISLAITSPMRFPLREP